MLNTAAISFTVMLIRFIVWIVASPTDSQEGVSTLTSRIFLKLEEMSADHVVTPDLGDFHAQLRALDGMKSRRY